IQLAGQIDGVLSVALFAVQKRLEYLNCQVSVSHRGFSFARVIGFSPAQAGPICGASREVLGRAGKRDVAVVVGHCGRAWGFFEIVEVKAVKWFTGPESLDMR